MPTLGRHDIEIIFFMTSGNEEFQRAVMNIDTAGPKLETGGFEFWSDRMSRVGPRVCRLSAGGKRIRTLGPTSAIATELRCRRARCVPAGKWMPVPCRSCRVTAISCSSGWL
jgi:hypothetical protein